MTCTTRPCNVQLSREINPVKGTSYQVHVESRQFLFLQRTFHSKISQAANVCLSSNESQQFVEGLHEMDHVKSKLCYLF